MAPARIYLDQNVYGHMLKAGDWRQHDIAAVLLRAENAGAGQVWLSPTNAVETSLATSPAVRAGLAGMMLELAAGTRILESSDMYLVRQFGEFLNQLVPEAFMPSAFMDRECETARLIWLGNLALLAGGYGTLGPGVSAIRRAKLETYLIHARMFAEPDAWIANVIAAASNNSTTTSRDPLSLGLLTDEQITAEIESLRPQFHVPTRKTFTLLQKNRADVAAAYGAVDIGGAIMAVLGHLPCALQLTFGTPTIVAAWVAVQNLHHVPPLPSEVTSATPAAQRADHDIVVTVLGLCIRAAAHASLAAATIGYVGLLREIEVCLNSGILPTPGAALDVDHATAALCADIVVCHDVKLANNLKSYLPSRIEVGAAQFRRRSRSRLGEPVRLAISVV